MNWSKVGLRYSVQDWSANGLNEHEWQYAIACDLKKELERRGVAVMMVGSGPTQDAATVMLEQWLGPVGEGCILSLHHDGAGSRHGYTMVIWRDAQDKTLRDQVVRSLKDTFPGREIQVGTDQQLSGKNLYDLRVSEHPHVLLEMANAESPIDAQWMKANRAAYVCALADAVSADSFEIHIGRYTWLGWRRVWYAALAGAKETKTPPLNKALLRKVWAGFWMGFPTHVYVAGPYPATVIRRVVHGCLSGWIKYVKWPVKYKVVAR